VSELVHHLAVSRLPERPALLDVGCGEGSVLAAVADEVECEAHGLDLSTPAIELAARRFPAIAWLVANADRFLPYATASAEAIVVVSARLPRDELARVLAPHGRLLVATAAPDDLVELREAVLGEGQAKDRMARAEVELAPRFLLEARSTARRRATLDGDALRDLLAATYRGARRSEQARVETLDAMPVTMSHDVARFRLA
jgi:23S rRNA (guanine745-N1)-methyltransferase